MNDCKLKALELPRYNLLVHPAVGHHTLGTFRSDYDYEYEYEVFDVYPVRMPDCARLSRQLVLSSKSLRRLDANYEIFNKARTPTTSSLQVQRRVKRLVFKGADTLWNVPCNLSCNALATLSFSRRLWKWFSSTDDRNKGCFGGRQERGIGCICLLIHFTVKVKEY